jgi:hypothetical protein
LSESTEQSCLVSWAVYNSVICYPLQNLYAVPNGTYTSQKQAAKANREGRMKGVPDLCLAWKTTNYASLYIEMKWNKGRLSYDQRLWRDKLRRGGNKHVTCYSYKAALTEMLKYLIVDFHIELNAAGHVTVCRCRLTP